MGELSRGIPTILAVHVPFMLPGVTPKNTKDIICGDPRFGFLGDTGWQVERRERWPHGGTSRSTMQFLEDLMHRFAAPHGPLLAILSGHEHLHRADALGNTISSPLSLSCDDSSPPRCEHTSGHRFGLPL